MNAAKRSVLAIVVAAALVSTAASPSAIDAAFKRFWNARNPAEASAAVEGIVKANPAFDEAYARLKRGRSYSSQVARGVVRLSHHFALGDFGYTLDVPETYDPSRRYQVRVQLHGGVTGRENGAVRGSGAIGALAGADQIYVLPISWDAALWWSNAQLENMRAILDGLERIYNVDENRVVLSGVSDGGTGTYYFAMRDTTRFASFLPLNGALAVLQNASTDVEGELFPQNLVNKPFFMVNGGRDPLYPAALVEPYIDLMKRGGVEVLYHPQPNGVHNTAWWPEEKDAFELFVREHPRQPLPDRLTWETDMTGGSTRAHWLVIDALGPKNPDRVMPDLNVSKPDLLMQFGLTAVGTTVASVIGGSSASTFSFERGDIVIEVEGRTVLPEANLGEILGRVAEGRRTIVVSRRGMRTALNGYFKPGTPGTSGQLFAHEDPSGRVDLEKDGNTVYATTNGVAQFTLLLSPDAFDLAKPVKVIVDGRSAFDGRVRTSLATLMKWAARDNDRAMLFGAELVVKVP